MTTINLTARQKHWLEWCLSAMVDHVDAEPEECSYEFENIPVITGMVADFEGMTNEAYEDLVYRLESQPDIADGNNRHNARTDLPDGLTIEGYVPANVGAITRVVNNIRDKIEAVVIADMPDVKSIPRWTGHPEEEDSGWTRFT